MMETDHGGSCGPPLMALASAINEVAPEEEGEEQEEHDLHWVLTGSLRWAVGQGL